MVELNDHIKKQDLFKFETYITRLFSILCFMKISPSYTEISFIKKLCSTCFVIISLGCATSGCILQIMSFKEVYDMPSFSQRVIELCFIALGTYKWYHCILKFDGLKELIELLNICHKLGYKIDDTDKDYKIYHQELLYAKKSSEYFMILWYVFVIAAISQWCLTPLTSDYYNNKNIDKNNENISLSRSYPNGATIPIEIKNLSSYLLMFLYQSLGIFFSAIGMSSCDILLISIMMYICAHLKYLNNCLIDDNHIQLILRSNNPSEKLKEKIKNCVIYHNQILKVHENYLSYSNGAMFAQCIENIIALCLVSLQASTMHYSPGVDFIVAFTSMIEYSMGISIELLAFCYYGTKLEELGRNVSDSFFFSNWDKLNIDKNCQDIQYKIQNIIKLGIMRAQKPIIITGGPFYIMNLETFKTLAYMSISNAIVLRQMSDE